jgi:hypothetical protein
MSNKSIVIFSCYPKSGSTWISRVVASLLDVDDVNNFSFINDNIERIHNSSDNLVIKDHIIYKDLVNLSKKLEYNLIYIVRDPRDIIVSGSNFFLFHRNKYLSYMYSKSQIFVRFYDKYVYLNLSNSKFRIKQMYSALLNGNGPNQFLSISWKDFNKPFQDYHVFYVKYENMLDNPMKECQRILQYLGVQKDINFIQRIIDENSFSFKKNQYAEAGNNALYSFLNKGTYHQWKSKLSIQQIYKINQDLKGELKYFSYKK